MNKSLNRSIVGIAFAAMVGGFLTQEREEKKDVEGDILSVSQVQVNKRQSKENISPSGSLSDLDSVSLLARSPLITSQQEKKHLSCDDVMARFYFEQFKNLKVPKDRFLKIQEIMALYIIADDNNPNELFERVSDGIGISAVSVRDYLRETAQAVLRDFKSDEPIKVSSLDDLHMVIIVYDAYFLAGLDEDMSLNDGLSQAYAGATLEELLSPFDIDTNAYIGDISSTLKYIEKKVGDTERRLAKKDGNVNNPIYYNPEALKALTQEESRKYIDAVNTIFRLENLGLDSGVTENISYHFFNAVGIKSSLDRQSAKRAERWFGEQTRNPQERVCF